jgi:hypothetical protein
MSPGVGQPSCAAGPEVEELCNLAPSKHAKELLDLFSREPEWLVEVSITLTDPELSDALVGKAALIFTRNPFRNGIQSLRL